MASLVLKIYKKQKNKNKYGPTRSRFQLQIKNQLFTLLRYKAQHNYCHRKIMWSLRYVGKSIKGLVCISFDLEMS
jgi:hypothetical protein